jgi:hypothetical protein
MAHIAWHGNVVEVWQNKIKPNTRYHVTDTGRLMRTTGPKNGGAKMIRVDDYGHVFVGKIGKLAHIDNEDVQNWLQGRAEKINAKK